jgi:ketosteroid isomerase-like protein
MTSDGSFDPKIACREWADACNACNVDGLTKLYHPRAQLWLAPSPTLAATLEAIQANFRASCSSLDPRRGITITRSGLQDFGDTVTTAGTAQVWLTRPDGQPAQFPVRYVFVCRKGAGSWLIVQRHASLMPPGPAR